MKRDMDLCREILRQMEEHLDPLGPVPVEVEGRSPEEINYHVYLLDDGGLIEAVSGGTSDFEHIPMRLTSRGQDFLNAARNDTIWQRGKERVLKVAGGLTSDLLLAALKAEIRERMGLDL